VADEMADGEFQHLLAIAQNSSKENRNRSLEV